MNFSQIAGVFSDVLVKLTSDDKAILVHPVNADGTSGIDVDIVAPNIDASCYIGKSTGTNGGDFTVAYTAATQLTFSSFPGAITALYAADIEAVRQINAAGAVVATYHRDDATMLMTGAVLTVTGAVFGATDKFIIFTNIPRPASSGSGGAGGGSIVYTNMSGDFIATPTNGTVTITITGLPFTLEAGHVALGSIKKKAVTTNVITTLLPSTISVSGGVITLGGISNFATGDEVYITLIGPDKAYDTALDNTLVAVQNPDYGHETSVETLISEDDVTGTNLTADAGGSATTLVDATGAFSIASTAVGYIARNITESTSATVTSVDSATQITTGAGITNWSSDEYYLPLVKRYEINMETYRNLTLHARLTTVANVTCYLKIYGTLDASATVDADTNWVDMSTALLGAAGGLTSTGAATTETLKYINAVNSPIPMLKYMLKLVVEKTTTGVSVGALYTVFVKKSS